MEEISETSKWDEPASEFCEGLLKKDVGSKLSRVQNITCIKDMSDSPDCDNSLKRITLLSKKSHSTPRRCVSKPDVSVNNNRLLFNLQMLMVPVYKNHELLGDSQFVRFSEQILRMRNYVSRTDLNSRFLGNCVSGQTIEKLKNRLTKNGYKVHSHVIMMIGTNDIVFKTDIDLMYESFNEILNHLQEKCERIVLVTVPPIPKYEKMKDHWYKLQIFNEFVQEKANNKQIFVVDICSLFISYNNSINHEFFEKVLFPGKPDLIHLNRKGLKILKAALDTLYFDD